MSICTFFKNSFFFLELGYFPTLINVVSLWFCFLSVDTVGWYQTRCFFVFLEKIDNSGGALHPLASLTFGAISGMLGQSSSYPLDIVRRRMQTDTNGQYHSIMHTLKTIHR